MRAGLAGNEGGGTRQERLEMKGERVIEVMAHADRTDDARK